MDKSIASVINAPSRFLTSVIAEFKHVTWPTKQETWRQTTMVMLVVAIVALLIAALDFLLKHSITFLLAL